MRFPQEAEPAFRLRRSAPDEKELPFEEAISIPLLARWLGVLAAGRKSGALVGNVDFLPTLCGLLDWPYPTGLDGRDLSGGWRGAADAAGRSEVLIADYLPCDEEPRQGTPVWRGVRSPRYTYVESEGPRPWLLFDNLADPCQLRNLIGAPEAAAIRQTLSQRLHQLLAESQDPFLRGENTLAALGLEAAWQNRQFLYHNS